MNRKQALKIQLEEWMLGSELMELIDVYKIEATKAALLRGEQPVIWMRDHDEYIFRIADGRDMTILANLRLWYDDGEREVRINENNYTEYDDSKFYSQRLGTYDIDIDL